MNRKILLLVIALIATMIGSSVNMAYASTVYTEYIRVGGACVINIPDKPLIRLVAYGQMYSDFYSGNNHVDDIRISIWTGTAWKRVAGYVDNPTRSEFSDGLGTGTVEYAVEPGKIQVLRDEENNINMVHWNIPLECPATTATPAVTIPPGKLVLQGSGELKTISYSNVPIGTTGWQYSFTGSYYYATAKFFCVDWKCKWVPVGAGYTGPYAPLAYVNWEWTWTHA